MKVNNTRKEPGRRWNLEEAHKVSEGEAHGGQEGEEEMRCRRERLPKKGSRRSDGEEA